MLTGDWTGAFVIGVLIIGAIGMVGERTGICDTTTWTERGLNDGRPEGAEEAARGNG